MCIEEPFSSVITIEYDINSEFSSILTERFIIEPLSMAVDKSIVWLFVSESKLTEIVADSISHSSSIKSSSASSESSPISLAIESANIGITQSITLGAMSLV